MYGTAWTTVDVEDELGPVRRQRAASLLDADRKQTAAKARARAALELANARVQAAHIKILEGAVCVRSGPHGEPRAEDRAA